MADLGNEYTLVELPAIEYLRDVLGYKNGSGAKIKLI